MVCPAPLTVSLLQWHEVPGLQRVIPFSNTPTSVHNRCCFRDVESIRRSKKRHAFRWGASDSQRCDSVYLCALFKKRRKTFPVIRDTFSSGNKHVTQVIDPVEKTCPLPRSKHTTSAPPLLAFSPRAMIVKCLGEFRVVLSVSCPEAPPGTRSCWLFPPKLSLSFNPVPSIAQCVGSSRTYGAEVIAPGSVKATPNRRASGA
jgi:hypothetical protein